MSYIVSVVPLMIIFYPTLQVEPLEAMTRIGFYLAFPLALAVSMAFVAVGYFLKGGEVPFVANSVIHRAADNSSCASGLKVS